MTQKAGALTQNAEALTQNAEVLTQKEVPKLNSWPWL